MSSDSLSVVEGLLNHLEHLVHTAPIRGGRIAREARTRLMAIADQIRLNSASPDTAERALRVRKAIATGNRSFVRYELDRIRYQIARMHHVSHDEIESGPLLGLEMENSRLRELLAGRQSQTQDESAKEEETETEEEENRVEQFQKSQHRAFVIMPFSHEFDDVWNGGIKRACQELKIAALRVDEINLSSGITDDIKKFVKKATTVVVDITGNNPNVMYELGYALGRGKKPIIICQGESKVPFDVANIRHLEYIDSWQGIEDLNKGLKKFLNETLNRRRPHKKKSNNAS